MQKLWPKARNLHTGLIFCAEFKYGVRFSFFFGPPFQKSIFWVKNAFKYDLCLSCDTERHQISCEQYWGFAWPPHQILAQSVNIEQSYGLSKSRYTPKNVKNGHFFFIKWKQGGRKVPKFSQELSLMLSTIVQNFVKLGTQVFPKNSFKFQKNQNFPDKFFLNTIPRPKFVTNDNNFLLDN